MKTGLLYGIVDSSKTRVRCVFCGVHIPKANKCIEQHTNGARHKENVELMPENGIAFNNNTLQCKPCRITLSLDDSVLKHIREDTHANWIAAMEDLIDGEFISLDPFLKSDKDDVYCEVCHISFQCTLPNIEAHVNGINHRISVTARLKPLNGIFAVDNDDELWCKICDIFIDNTTHSILEHVDDDMYHLHWFATIEDLIKGQGITIENYLINEYDSNIYCTKCLADIACDTQSIKDHIGSAIHLSHFS